jgi:hypothetical protein
MIKRGSTALALRLRLDGSGNRDNGTESLMFEVGKRYGVRMIIDGEETISWRTIECYEHPLLKFADVNVRSQESHLPDTTLRGEIINVTSPNFISAVRYEPQTQEEITREDAGARSSAPKED